MTWKSEDGPSSWAPATHMEDPDVTLLALGQPGSGLAIVVIWGADWMGDLFLFSPSLCIALLSSKQIFKEEEKELEYEEEEGEKEGILKDGVSERFLEMKLANVWKTPPLLGIFVLNSVGNIN